MNSRRNKKTSANGQQNLVRIIGGMWRGRKLQFPDVEGLRPTSDRVRETVFNWLAPIIPNAHCLDLFAGSGAMGLEALSRGAASAILVEKNTVAATALQQHCKLLNTVNATIVHGDALNWLTTQTNNTPFDVVFLDPPFDSDLLQSAIEILEQKSLLTEQCHIYIETPIETQAKATALKIPPNWRLLKEKMTRQVCYRLFCRI